MMRGYIRTFVIGITAAALMGGGFLYAQENSATGGVDSAALKEEIQQRAAALEEIRQEQERIQYDIEETLGEQQSLKSELRRISYSVDQLDLGIRSSEITIDKLSLEVEYIQGSIDETRTRIVDSRSRVASLVKEIYQGENESPLFIVLRHRTLSESFNKLQSINTIAAELAINVEELRNLEIELTDALALAREKKDDQEKEYFALQHKKDLLDDQEMYKRRLLNETKNEEYRYRAMLSELREQQEAVAREIEDLEENLRMQIDPDALPDPRAGVLAWPAEGILTQGYGKTSFSYNYKSKWHNGIDIGAPIGTPLYAAEDGVVKAVWDQDKYCYRGAYGKFIVIEHDNNLTTMYAHLSGFLPGLEEGDRVKRGEVIGYMGSSGWSTGSHLHFVVYSTATFRIGPSKLTCGPKMPYGGDLDPFDYLP